MNKRDDVKRHTTTFYNAKQLDAFDIHWNCKINPGSKLKTKIVQIFKKKENVCYKF